MSDEPSDPPGPRPPPPPRGGRPGRGTRPTFPDRPCLNCGDPTTGEYCPTCGQRKVDIQVSLRALFMEILEDDFILDKRLPRTLGALLFRPGRLTVDHVNGRIARHVHPFRLYLVTSLLFFLILSFFSLRLVRTALQDGGDGPVVETTADASADSLAQRIADLNAAVIQLDEAAADTAVPAAVRMALQANRSVIERQLRAASAQREALLQETGDTLADTLGSALPDTVGGEPAATPLRAEDRSLAELFEWDESPPTISTPFPAAVDSVLAGQVRRLGGMRPREAAETVAGTFFRYVPTMMFLLLPVFAGILKLLYIRRRRFYAEHFVFLLHVHSMVFILATFLLLLRGPMPGWVQAGVVGWVLVYIYLAMKQVYGQGWLKSFVKYWILTWTYFWILNASILVVFVAALILF